MSILIVHRDPDLAEELRLWVETQFEPSGLLVETCVTLAEARVALERSGPPELLVVGTLLADATEAGARELVLEMRRRWQAGAAIPALLIVPAADPMLDRALRDVPAVSVVCEGGNLERDFRYALNWLLPGLVRSRPESGFGKPRPRYNVILRIAANGKCSCEVKSLDAKIHRASHCRFGVKRKQLQALLDQVPSVPAAGDWSEAVRKIGADLMLMLIHRQAPVMQELGIVKGLSMADENVELGLCFSVDQVLYPIPFEALKALDFGEAHRYWLQDSLLWRSLPECPSGRLPLFAQRRAGDPPINCLLIAAACDGDVELANLGGQPGTPYREKLRPLTETKNEIDAIERELMRAEATGIGRIRKVWIEDEVVHTSQTHNGSIGRPCAESDAFDEVLQRFLLEEGPWDVVHFAGHSCFVGPKGQEIGYLFVPQREKNGHGTSPKAIGVATVAPWLKDARFVYLSGCSSAHWKVVYDLCAHSVPAMTGYRWEILDKSALRCAQTFYRHLLGSRCIETAMRSSWIEIFGNARDDWAWASSQFVIQG